MTGLTMKILSVDWLQFNFKYEVEAHVRFFYRQREGSFTDEVKDIVQPSTEDAYRMAMTSMLEWVRSNMDPEKTRVFFVTMSPSHEK